MRLQFNNQTAPRSTLTTTNKFNILKIYLYTLVIKTVIVRKELR